MTQENANAALALAGASGGKVAPELNGAFEVSLDEGYGLSLPNTLLRHFEILGSRVIVHIGLNRKLWLYPVHYYQAYVEGFHRRSRNGAEIIRFFSSSAFATRIAFELDSRLALPEYLCTRCNLSREVMVVGGGEHLEVWNPPDWKEHPERLVLGNPWFS